MYFLGQSLTGAILLTAICLTLCSALPHGKKYRHHLKSKEHVDDDFKPKRDPWKSWDNFKDDLDKKDFESPPFGDQVDKYERKDDKKEPSSAGFVDKKKDYKFKGTENVDSLGNGKKLKTRDYSKFEDKNYENKEFSEDDFKKPYDLGEKTPAIPEKDSEKLDYFEKKADFRELDGKKIFDVETTDNKDEEKPKFGHWPIGDDTDKLPQPTTAATKPHYLRLSKPLVRCKSEYDCPMSRVCKDGYCHCAEKSYCARHSSPVCGSDGILYPSHCELHRTACMKTVHIKIDHKGLCFEKERGTESVGYIPVSKPETPDALPAEDVKGQEKEAKDDFTEQVKDFSQQKVKDTFEKPTQGKEEEPRIKYIDDAIEIDKKEEYEKDEKFDVFDKKDYKYTDSEKKDEKKYKSETKEFHKKYDKEKENTEEKETDQDKKTDFYEKKDFVKKINFDSDKKDDKKSAYSESTSSASKVTEKPAEVPNIFDTPTYDKETKFDDDKDEYDDYDEFSYYDDLKTLSNVKESLKKGMDGRTPAADEVCPDEEYRHFKEELLKYHCLKFEEPDCDNEVIDKRKFLASLMFSYYDRNFDDYLELEELEQIEMKEHYEKLSDSCILVDILRFEDTAKDGKLSIEEFFDAFNLDQSVLDDRVKILSLTATVGHGLELTCGIKDAKDIVWKRHGVDVNSLHMDDISAFEDGTLYISRVGVHHMGNFSCHDRKNPAAIQTHLIRVQMPPQVKVMPGTQLHHTHTDVTLKCHAEGVPRPKISWEINEVPIPNDMKHFERRNENHTLIIHDSDYQKDTGAYKCRATNLAGVSQDIATVFIQNFNTTQINPDIMPADNMFIVFHNKGYNIYEPQHCLVRHEVKGDFTNLKYFPEMMDSVMSLCGEGECDWGTAINVANKFVYASQPSMNRLVVIDVSDQWNPIQLVDTDNQPMGLHYVPHLDQVWVLCWNGGRDSGSKTMVVIRDASKQQRHQIVHTQPVGNRFDLIQDMFLPPANDLGHHFEFGYVVHTGQRGLYKLELEEMKYIKSIDFTKHNCHPKSIVFVPIGGMLVIQCQAETVDSTKHFQLVMDYLSDIVVSNSSLRGTPYVSPDSRYLVTVDSITGEVDVRSVSDQGILKKEFTVSTGSPLNEVTFHPSTTHKGYNLYLSSRTKGVVFFMDLSTGKLMNVDGIEERVHDSWLWDGMKHALVGSGLFGDFLLTTTEFSAIIIDGKLQKVECEFRDLKNSHVVVWIQPEIL